MMRTKIIMAVAFACVLVHMAWGQQDSFWNVESRLIINGETREELIRWTEQIGGYAVLDSRNAVELRIPVEQLEELPSALEAYSNRVLSYDLFSREIGAEIRQARAAIASREETLARNLEFLDDADVTGTLALEREIASLISEIEGYKGRLRVLENQRRFASLSLLLTAPAPRAPGSGESSFPWLERIDFYGFMGGNQRSSRGFSMELPEGFAAPGGIFTPWEAVSPEGFRARIYREQNEPRQDLEFWVAAYSHHMDQSGYLSYDEAQFIEAEGGRAYVAEWLVPYAGESYLYAHVIMVRGRNIAVVELAGPEALYRNYRDALIEAVATLR
jgi:hypothetical protein